MSLEAALEEERLEILKLLERPKQSSSPYHHHSGAYSTPSSPRQNYVSVIPPIGHPRSPIHGHTPSVSSLIDAVTAASPSPSLMGSRSTSPNGIYRTRSETTGYHNGAPKLLRDRDKPASAANYGMTPNDAYNFSMLPSVPTHSPVPKRVSQGGSTIRPMLPPLYDTSSVSVPQSARSPFGQRPISPNALQRSSSPRGSSSGRLSSPPPVRHQLIIENGSKIDLDHAYSRLSDDALARSGGVLQSLPERKPLTQMGGEQVQAGSGEYLTKEGGVRLQKDYQYGSEDERAAADSSEDSSTEDSIASNSGGSEEEERGRLGTRSTTTGESETSGSGDRAPPGMIRIDADPGGGGHRKHKAKKGAGKDIKKGFMRKTSMSLLAAAEEERKAVSAKYKVRSLLPSISITPSVPGANSPTTTRRTGVHPTTNFDVPSHTSTPMSSDTEADVRDLRRAQRMEMSISPIMTNPESQRVIRTIIRGEYEDIVKEADEGQRRCRKYLVATDLSGEAQHALEWTIGTVLRDGDTLMAIYAVDQDTVEDGDKPVDSVAETSYQAAAVGTNLSPSTSGFNSPITPSPLASSYSVVIDAENTNSNNKQERSRERTKAEQERFVAVEAITTLVARLLKKTRLQVKVTVEVIHCKSPKHLLIEIIDLVEPTLVILGSRGRSALKGVLLGSFSNYLVTKSSVPVMVARKKLKHTKKFVNTHVRLANNLTANVMTRQLANAKVD